ncbi:MAG: hypothetical protein EA360_12100 [Balneolaceae bacterium]|nr:MAG: hypothetical protein EA360_12100 [Balneolaceae bacterium]
MTLYFVTDPKKGNDTLQSVLMQPFFLQNVTNRFRMNSPGSQTEINCMNNSEPGKSNCNQPF